MSQGINDVIRFSDFVEIQKEMHRSRQGLSTCTFFNTSEIHKKSNREIILKMTVIHVIKILL